MDSQLTLRALTVGKRYLHFPVKTGAPKRRVALRVAGQVVREFDIELPEDHQGYFVFIDVARWLGAEVTIEAQLPEGSRALAGITQSDDLPDPASLYREKYRPQFHFTSKRGWLNDPNGLVYYDREWHLFYQHNPYGWKWGNMHWGHAVSPDLVHWTELGIALFPRQYGDWAYSGCAVVDHENSSGFGREGKPPLVLSYTSTGRGECMAYSHDNGRTWIEYEGNPVITHDGRDPKIFWHAPSRQWVMAVYDIIGRDPARRGSGEQTIAFFTSPDLKQWMFRSRVLGYHECPDLIELPVDGDVTNTKWVLYGADARYVVGRFDGVEFVPEGHKQQVWSGRFYAAQTFANAPGGRCVQVGWANKLCLPGMPFNQQMALPVDLSLRTTPEGIRLFVWPVKEIEGLRREAFLVDPFVVTLGAPVEVAVPTGEYEMILEADVSEAESLKITLKNGVVTWMADSGDLACGDGRGSLRPINGKIRLRIFVDRGSVEVFGNDGAVALSAQGFFPPCDGRCEFAADGMVRISKVKAFRLESAWRV